MQFYLLTALLLLLPLSSLAYIDPGTGSAIMSAIIGACVAGSMVIQLYWAKLVSFVKKIRAQKKPPEKS